MASSLNANEHVLAILREVRGIEAKDPVALARGLLEILVVAMASTRASLLLPPASEVMHVGGEAAASDGARLELRLPRRGGAALLVVERVTPFAAKDATLAEILGGEIVGRLDRDHAEREASRVQRQLQVLHALSRAAAQAERLPEVADRAAVELLSAFDGAHVLVHVLADDHLELVARRIDGAKNMDDAPDWIRHLPLDGDSVMASAARTKAVVCRAISEIPVARRQILESLGLHQLVVVPLLFHDEVFGTFTVSHRSELPADPSSLRLFEEAAAQLAIELAHVRLLEAERRRAEDLGLINEIGGLVAQHIDLPSVLTTAVKELARLTHVWEVDLFLADDAKTVLTEVATTTDRMPGLAFPVTSKAMVVQAFHTREPVVIEDATVDARTDKVIAAKTGARAIMAVPLLSRGEAIGALALVEAHPRTFTTTEVARAVAVANLVSPAVANAKMFDDLRRSYDALARTQAELVTHERLAALGELSAVIAHEVRNPLAVIFNSLGALRRIQPRTADATLLLDIVGEEAARLNRIVGDLLDFVRPYTAHPRHVQIDTIVCGAVEAASRAAPNAHVEVLTELDLACNDAILDGAMLHQALINLIVNAMQATPEGRTITVRACAPSGATRLCFEVRDEGPGIDSATRARIFQPFFTTKATGTGLGLALVRRIADTLGGVVEAASAPSGGAVFMLTVPFVPVPHDVDLDA